MGAALALALGCHGNTLATSPSPNSQIDVFNQVPRTKSDILWVVDNSGSMAREQQQLAESFPRFFSHLEDSGVDYRIAITTADIFAGDGGELVGSPTLIVGNSSDPAFPDTADPQAAFAASIHVGTNGSARDEAFENALLTLRHLQTEAGAASDAGHGVAFLRSDAALFLIFVGDGREYSPPVDPPPSYNLPGVQTYWREFVQAKGIGDNALVSISAIAGDTPNGCIPVGCSGDAGPDAGATDPGFRYQEMTELAGGLFHSICDCNFDTALDELGLQAIGLTRKFHLSRVPNPATLAVEVDSPCSTLDPTDNLYCLPLVSTCPSGYGSACISGCSELGLKCTVPQENSDAGPNGDGWSYDPNDNSMTFNGLALPVAGAQVTIRYDVPAGM